MHLPSGRGLGEWHSSAREWALGDAVYAHQAGADQSV